MNRCSRTNARNQERSTKVLAPIRLLAAIGLFLLVVLPTAAFATESGGEEAPASELTMADLHAAQAAHGSLGSQLTDSEAASELPHRDLDRQEVLDLLEGAFQSALQVPAGDFDSLDVKKFLSDNTAIVFPPEDTSSAVVSAGGGEDGAHETTPALLESTVPLRVESPNGSYEPVDLSLEHVDGQLESAAPIEPVSIPEELGTGIDLQRLGIQIEIVGAPEGRAPSIIEESVATYPNVDTDTDLSVAPTATGIETLTSLRSPDAPRNQAFRLKLPTGDDLVESKEGGAEVLRAGEPILRVLPPTAIDAAGTNVPVSMAVNGDTLVVTTEPQIGTVYPILVDPLYESFAWKVGATPGWGGWDPYTNSTIIPGYGENWGSGWNGIYLEAQANYYYVGSQASWTHTVPRLAAEEAKGTYPTSYISNFALEGLYFETSAGLPSPFLFGGIFNTTTQKWVTGSNGQEAVWSWPGNGSWAWGASVTFDSGQPGKQDRHAYRAYGMSLAVSEAGWLTAPRASYLGAASVVIDDDTRPTVASVTAPSGWMNQTATGPIVAEARDTGLGVKNVTFIVPGQGEKTIGNACGGQTQDPCPSAQSVSLPAGQYSPALIPQGVNKVSVRALDVLGNATAEAGLGKAEIKVDHTAPTVALSGSMTEQASLGTGLPQYKLRYVTADGTVAEPQSGAVKTEVKIDGKAAETYSPGCSTENCSISREWTLLASSYSAGTHTVEVVATDGVGLKSTKALTIKLSKDEAAPSLSTEGGFFAGPEGWLEQKGYSATIKAIDPGGYGVKTLNFKFDGASVQSKSQSCPSGGCGASIAATMNMALYEGGAHTVEATATDAAGNTSTRTWTINIDPSGTVSDEEAAATLEAMEDTEPESTIVTPTSEAIPAAERADGNDPALKADGGDLISVGVPVETTISGEAGGGVTIESTEGDIEVNPVTLSDPDGTVINEIAATDSDAATGTDSVIRPKYDGALQFQSIREASAPESFSWEVTLQNGQTLSALEGGKAAAVYFKDGEQAMLIEAMPAADAVGHEVPTHLSVTGKNIVTLTVEHRKQSYVYPVVAGPAFEVGYVTVEAIVPPPPLPPAPEGTGLQLIGRSSAPQLLSLGNTDPEGATASSVHPHHSITYDWDLCVVTDFNLFGALSGCDIADLGLEARFEYNGLYAWWKESKPHPKCPLSSGFASLQLTYCNWAGPNHQPYGGGYHITALAKDLNNGFAGVTFTAPEHLALYLYGDAYGKGHNTENICNPLSTCPG